MRVIKVEKVPTEVVYAITTSTATFIADGLAHHNCWACNYKHEYDPYPYMQWAEQKLGKDGLEALHIRYNTPRKFKDHDLEDLIKELTA